MAGISIRQKQFYKQCIMLLPIKLCFRANERLGYGFTQVPCHKREITTRPHSLYKWIMVDLPGQFRRGAFLTNLLWTFIVSSAHSSLRDNTSLYLQMVSNFRETPTFLPQIPNCFSPFRRKLCHVCSYLVCSLVLCD